MRNFRAVLAAILIMTFVLPAAAYADEAELSTLTVDAAVEMAIANSAEIRKIANDQKSAEEKLDYTKKSLSDASYGNSLQLSITNLDFQQQLLQYNLSNALAEQNKAAQRDLINVTVTEYFISILNAERDLSALSREIEIGAVKRVADEVRLKYGRISELDYKKAVLEYENLKSSKITYESTIAKSYQSLNKAIGKPLEDRYALEFAYSYEPLGEMDLKDHSDQCIRVDSNIKNLEMQIETALYNRDNYILKNTNGTSGEYKAGSTTEESYGRTAKELNAEISERKLTIEESVNNKYDEIKEMELKRDEAAANLLSLNEQLAAKAVQLKLGKITRIDYDEFELSVLKAEYELGALEMKHNLEVMKFVNPNTAFN